MTIFHMTKGCEGLDVELTNEQRGKNKSEDFSDSDAIHILLKLGEGHNKMLWG